MRALILGLSLWAASPLAAAEALPAPAFAVMDMSGTAWTQQGPARGVLLVDFWASWCPPCLKAIPALNALQAKYGPTGRLSVLGLCMDKGGQAAAAMTAKKRGIAYAVAAADPALATAYKVQGFPSVFVLKGGQVVARLGDPGSLAAFERALEPWLK